MALYNLYVYNIFILCYLFSDQKYLTISKSVSKNIYMNYMPRKPQAIYLYMKRTFMLVLLNAICTSSTKNKDYWKGDRITLANLSKFAKSSFNMMISSSAGTVDE